MIKSNLITLFARKEKTRDPVSIQHGLADKQDTVLYADASCTQQKVVWPWYLSTCPDRRYRTVMLNCWRWNLKWVTAC